MGFKVTQTSALPQKVTTKSVNVSASSAIASPTSVPIPSPNGQLLSKPITAENPPKTRETRLKREPKEYRPNPLSMDLRTVNRTEHVTTPAHNDSCYKKLGKQSWGVRLQRQLIDWATGSLGRSGMAPTAPESRSRHLLSTKRIPKYSLNKRPVPSELIGHNSTHMRIMNEFSSFEVLRSPGYTAQRS